MTDTSDNQGTGLAAEDTTQFLQRLFTGHVVSKDGLGGGIGLAATVVSATATTCIVEIVGFEGVTFTCNYETRVVWPGIPSPNTTVIPPPGTACVCCFPPNDPTKTGWVMSFECYYNSADP